MLNSLEKFKTSWMIILKKLVNNIIELSIDEIDKFNFHYGEFEGLKIIEDEVEYEFLFRFSKEKHDLICFRSDAIDRNGPNALDPPIFSRHSWNNHFKESVLYYNDTTLYR
ncbi:hypothetical protein ALNOE001_11740 [Candidatus Methanobinarius endosymbioticus]|uniref:Uncharacterized protein n=1 Tax=Candidatus Methanobinarius endosymbioticus TaxID=2006182 RepID=A0A366MA03_9EURY|nr:hypothetical protein ALNOE001_11740 [Candidatus Methanobinarius endosymbioticus]